MNKLQKKIQKLKQILLNLMQTLTPELMIHHQQVLILRMKI